MSLKDLVTEARPIGVSFEFFPPNSAAMEEQLWRAVKRLEPLQPAFVSITYGAGGSTRERTHATVRRIVEETTLRPAAHLTCVAASREEVLAVLQRYASEGLRVLAVARRRLPEGARS